MATTGNFPESLPFAMIMVVLTAGYGKYPRGADDMLLCSTRREDVEKKLEERKLYT